jgi:hypothetical protein
MPPTSEALAARDHECIVLVPPGRRRNGCLHWLVSAYKIKTAPRASARMSSGGLTAASRGQNSQPG